MNPVSTHEWLRRVSDYHSGGVNGDEAAAVEEHLASCAECRQALQAYRRLYALASSPLRLGEPSPEFGARLHTLPAPDLGNDVGEDEWQMGEPRTGARALRPQGRRFLGVVSLLAASIVILGFLAVLGPRLRAVGTKPTPTVLLGPTPTAQTSNLPEPGTGYTPEGPNWATMLVFAPSSSQIAFTCGEYPFQGGPLLISVSHDGGHSWQSRTSPGILTACELSVDPTNPLDLALIGQYCSLSYATYPPPVCEPHTHLFRSYDGALTWTEVSSPGGDWVDTEFTGPGFRQLAWVGNDLFIGTTLGLARSVDAGPFTLLHQPFFGTSSVEISARRLLTSGAKLFVTYMVCSPTPAPSGTCNGQTASSADLGAHWTLLPMRYRSMSVTLDDALDDGQTLLGIQIPARILLRSLDGGTTWHPLPPYPSAFALDAGGFDDAIQGASLPWGLQAADGTIYIEFEVSGTASGSLGIYVLVPGATNWRYLAPSPAGGMTILLWDRVGHLAAIWGGRGTSTGTGLEYRLF